MSKCFWFLVDTVICQMLIQVLHGVLRAVIWFWCKSSQSLVINVNPEWIYTRYQNINSQIKFMAIDQKWVRDIFTNNSFFIGSDLKFIQFINDIYASSLRALRWFYYPKVILFYLRDRIVFVTFSVIAYVFLYLCKTFLK